MTPSPSVTWPSPAMTTAPLRRTQRTVVDRIRRFVGMRAILDYNSGFNVRCERFAYGEAVVRANRVRRISCIGNITPQYMAAARRILRKFGTAFHKKGSSIQA